MFLIIGVENVCKMLLKWCLLESIKIVFDILAVTVPSIIIWTFYMIVTLFWLLTQLTTINIVCSLHEVLYLASEYI